MTSAIEILNGWSGSWLDFMWYRVIESTIVFLVVGAVWLVVHRRASARFGYLLYGIVLLKLIVPGQIPIPAIPQVSPSQSEGTSVFGEWGWLWGAGDSGQTAPSAVQTPKQPTTDVLEHRPSVTPASLLMLGWAMLVLAGMLRLAWMVRRTHLLLRKTTPLELRKIPIDLEHLRQISGVKQPVRWVTAPWVKAPITYGHFRPIIAVPPDLFVNFTPNQIRWILLHELAHISWVDAFVCTLQTILKIVFFFHPVVWWANSKIDQFREYACDDEALSRSRAPRSDCGEGFLSVAVYANGLPRFLPAALGMINYKTTIRRRLMRILDNQRKLNSRLSLGAAVFILAMTLVVLPFGAKMAVAQVGEWVKVEIAAGRLTKPSSRVWHSMAYDSRRGVIVLHGGGSFSTTTAYKDTWEYDGKAWTRVSTDGPARYAHSMAYDEERGVTVLCGGPPTAGGTPLPGTWEWDGQKWKEADADLPSGRLIPGMAYDPVRKVVVLHGGARDNSYNVLSDTWQWNGQTWTQLEDGPQRWDQEMEYDSVRGKMVMFGGYESRGVTPTDTWEFDGTHWKCVATEGPEGRCSHSMVFDPFRGVAVLLGGFIAIGQGSPADAYYYDMWEWNGEKWYQLDVTLKPQSCIVAGMAFDEGRKKIVLFGGMRSWGVGESSDTWEYTAAGSGIPQALWSLY